jgi:branched-chain amino acid aminotransferase
MNVFFRINDTLLTALTEKILDGITRKSLIDMAIKKGFKLMCVL